MTAPRAPRTPHDSTGVDDALLETLVHEAGDGLFVVGTDLTLSFANRRGSELSGYSRDELLGLRIDELLDRDELRARPLRVLDAQPGTVVIGERTLRCKGGTTLPVEISGRRLPDGRLLAVVRDIRERRATLARLVVQAQALASSVAGICFADLHGTVTYGNPAFIALWGFESETEALGYDLRALWADAAEGDAAMRTVLAGEAWVGTVQARRRDGGRFPVDVVGSAIRDAEGRVFGIMVSLQDASDRERDARHIASLTRLYAVLSGVNQAVVRATTEVELFQSVCDVAVDVGGMRMAWVGLSDQDGRGLRAVARAGHEDGYLALDFSTSAAAREGHGPTGRALRDGILVTTEDIAHDVTMAPWRDAALSRGYRSSAAMPFRRGGQVVGTVNLYSRDASFFTEAERGLLDEIGAAITFALDAREAAAAREALRSQLMQAQKMESIGRLAGGVAHDFNNMLSVILGHAELALGTLEAGRPERDDLLQVQEAANRSAQLTRQLLAFARRQPIAPRVLQLEDAIAASLKMLRRLIGEDITLAWRPGPGLWPVVLDPTQLDQILTNLVVNARDAIGGVGTIELSARNETIDATVAARVEAEPGAYVAVAVADTGSGMDAETLAHAFEPFFTTKREGQGTGLGLSTVYGIARQNGGFVTVSSAVGRGTTLTLHLPRAKEAQDDARGGDDAAALPRGTERILLVEDEAAVRELTRRMLERLGYGVIAAASPSEALRLLEDPATKIDLAVLDVVMPEMNGVTLCARLRTLRPALRALFVSAYPAEVVSARGLLTGETRYLAKPFSARQLAQAVRDALGAAVPTSA